MFVLICDLLLSSLVFFSLLVLSSSSSLLLPSFFYLYSLSYLLPSTLYYLPSTYLPTRPPHLCPISLSLPVSSPVPPPRPPIRSHLYSLPAYRSPLGKGWASSTYTLACPDSCRIKPTRCAGLRHHSRSSTKRITNHDQMSINGPRAPQ